MKCLTIICAIISLLLGATHTVTAPIIDEANKKAAIAARLEVLPGATDFVEKKIEKEGIVDAYAEKENKGFTITAKSNGYGGAIQVMVGFNYDGDITGIKVLSHQETQGIGTKVVASKKYLDQYTALNVFSEKNTDANTSATPNIDSVDAVTGATVSSNAFFKAVTIAIDAFKELRGYTK